MRYGTRVVTVDESPEAERSLASWQVVNNAKFSNRAIGGRAIAVDDDSPEPERINTAPRSSWQSVNTALFTKYPFQAEETMENATLLGYEVSGFLNRRLNGVYVLKRDEVVGDQATYWSENGTYFMYYQQQARRWQICERWEVAGPGRPVIDLLHEARLGNRRRLAQQTDQTSWLELFAKEWHQRWLHVDHLMAVPDPDSHIVKPHVQIGTQVPQTKPLSMAAKALLYSLPEHCFKDSPSKLLPPRRERSKILFQPWTEELEQRLLCSEVDKSMECRVWVGWFPESVEHDEILTFLEASKDDVLSLQHKRGLFSVAIISFKTLRAAEHATRFDGKFLGGRKVQVGHYDEGADVPALEDSDDSGDEKAGASGDEEERRIAAESCCNAIEESTSALQSLMGLPQATHLIVDGAGGKANAINGTYIHAGVINGRTQYKQHNGDTMICFRRRWKIYATEYGGSWWFSHPDSTAVHPPANGWLKPKTLKESCVEIVCKDNGGESVLSQASASASLGDSFWGEDIPTSTISQAIQLVVDGAGRSACAANGAYMHAGFINGKALYKQLNGDTMICFRRRWKIYVKEYGGKWWFLHPDSSSSNPPVEGWTKPKSGEESNVQIVYKGQLPVADPDTSIGRTERRKAKSREKRGQESKKKKKKKAKKAKKDSKHGKDKTKKKKEKSGKRDDQELDEDADNIDGNERERKASRKKVRRS